MCLGGISDVELVVIALSWLVLEAKRLRLTYQLRKEIFLVQSKVYFFYEDDEDDIDQAAYPIIAIDNDGPRGVRGSGEEGLCVSMRLSLASGMADVLGVHPDYRRVGRIGKGLIQKAVTNSPWLGLRSLSKPR